MTKKWKEFSEITGITTFAIVGEAGWTGLLVWGTSKIPYVGIPISILIGSIGIIGTAWIARTCDFAYQDWYKRYYTK